MKATLSNYTKKHIIALGVLHFVLSLFYANLIVDGTFVAKEQFFRVLMGGLQVEDSTSFFCILLSILPSFFLCILVGNQFMQELKNNFLYIFLRTKKRSLWLNKNIQKILFSILYYEGIFIACVLLLKFLFYQDISIRVMAVFEMMVMKVFQLSFIMIFSSILLLFVSDATGILITFICFALPVLITGSLYDNNGPWELAAKWIIFNWGNYNYSFAVNMNSWVYIIMIGILNVVLYMVAKRKINRYELF